MFRKFVSILSPHAVLITLLGLAGAGGALAEHSPGKTLVGAWDVLITNNAGLPPAVDVTVMNRDGTMSNSDPVLGTGHGAWKRLGDGTSSYRFRTPVLITNPFGLPPGTVLTVSGLLTVDEGGMTASGPYEAVAHDPTGAIVLAFDGIVFLTRIMPDH